MSTTVGNLKAQLDLSASGLGAQIAKVGQQFGQMKSQIVGSLNQIHPALGTLTNALTGPAGIAAAGLATATGLGVAFKRLMTESESIESVADRLNMGTEFFERLQHAAFRTDTSFGTVTSAWQRMQIEISKASSGGGKANIYEQLGLDAASLAAGSPEQAFKSIAGAIAQIENPVQRARMEYELFGRSGVELEGVLRMTAAGLGDIAVVSEESRKKMADLENQWLDFKNSVTAGGKELAIGVAFGFGELRENMREFGALLGGGAEGLRNYIDVRDRLARQSERQRSQSPMDVEAAAAEAKQIEDRVKIMERAQEKLAAIRDGENAVAAREYEKLGGDPAELMAVLEQIDKATAAKEREKRATERQKQLEDERLSTLRQLREEADRLAMGEHNWELRGLNDRERQEAMELRAEIDRLTKQQRPGTAWSYAGAATRGSAEAYSAVLQHENPQLKAQREGNRIAEAGFRRVETAIGNIDRAAIAAAPTN